MGLVPTKTAQASHGVRRLSEDPVLDNQLQRLVASKRRIAEIQARQPKAVFSLNTPFALMTSEEFKAFASGGRGGDQRRRKLQASDVAASMNTTAQRLHERVLKDAPMRPETWESREQGCVGVVKDRGICHADWAFAAVGALETATCVHSGKKTVSHLSEQELLSCAGTALQCDWRDGTSTDAFEWIVHKNGGTLCTSATIPFVAAAGNSVACPVADVAARCERSKIDVATYINTDYLETGDLETVVWKRGAVAVSIIASPLQYYDSGIITDDDETHSPGDEESDVVIVGYGYDNDEKFWRLKNNWGTGWGEAGYFRIARGSQSSPHGTCGIQGWSNYPIFRDEIDFRLDRSCLPAIEGVELLGRDLKNVSTFDPSRQCCDICRFEPGCVGATWHNESYPHACVLKATIEGTRPYADGFGGHLVMSDSNAPETPKPAQCTKFFENVAFPLNDLVIIEGGTVSDCCTHCWENPNCVVYTWNSIGGAKCHLKHAKATHPLSLSPLPDGSPIVVSGEVHRA
ncbi:hypothetical protein PINS_up004213 [Pythium insidiosum]|nr:hypothetical protein PINS_up004213 [Pythium insidiosum]